MPTISRFDDLPKSREEAVELGSEYFFSGKPCKNGHISRRKTQSLACSGCRAVWSKRYKARAPKRVVEVTHKQSGKVFKTAAEAAKFCNISVSSVWRSIYYRTYMSYGSDGTIRGHSFTKRVYLKKQKENSHE